MERWNGEIVDINGTCKKLGPKCLQLLGMHALNGCDTVSYPFKKGRIGALNILQARNFPGLYAILCEEDDTESELMNTRQEFFAALYGQPPGTSMNAAHYSIYTGKKGKPVRIMDLPPTDANVCLYVQRGHLEMILWKAADQPGPPTVDIGKFGWHEKDGIPSPTFAADPPAPPGLIDVLSCCCKAEGKACSYTTCSCQRNQLSCSIYCMCGGWMS